MTEPSQEATDTAAVGATLDALGHAAAGESPTAPPAPSPASTAGRPRRWLAAAAAVAVVAGVGAGAWWVGRDDVIDQVAGPNEGALPPPPSADVDLVVDIGAPSGPDGTMQATLTNRSDRRAGLGCAVWRLDRWDGRDWQVVAVSAMWDENGQLALFDTELTIDCGETVYIQPGASVQRPIVPAWTLRVPSGSEVDGGADTVAEPLTPGTYRLVLPARPPHTVQAQEPIEADARLFVAADDVPPTTVAPDCEPLGRAAIAEVLGEPAASPPTTLPPTTVAGDTVPVPTSTTTCAAESGQWNVGYELGAARPSPAGSTMLGEPTDIGDEAYITTSIGRSGLWTGMGFVRVGERAATVSVRSSAVGSDTYSPTEGPAVEPVVRDRTLALLAALAERL